MARSKHFRYAQVLLLIIAAATMPVLAAPASVPLAPVSQDLNFDTQITSGQWHLQEAKAKARALSKAMQAKALATPNMELFDVTFYDLDLDLDHDRKVLTGSVTVVAQVVGPELSELDLNLQDSMDVTEIRAGTTVLGHDHRKDILTVTLDRTYLTGETVTIEVDYQGNPASEYFAWDTFDDQPMIWTLSECLGSSYWWPCKDLNSDKADSVSLHVTVTDPLYVVSNGSLRGVTVTETGRSTYHWHESYPIAPYLVSLAIYPYVITEDTYHAVDGRSMPLMYYTFPAYSDDVLGGYGVVKDIMALSEQLFGPYPFIAEKYGHAHFTWGGGMEHQTCASIICVANTSGYSAFYAHELVHQWFGDMVTADFHHLWLNEGIAEWFEAFWAGYYYSSSSYNYYMDSYKYLGNGTIYVENTDVESKIWDIDLVYYKGAWVIHMLRHVLGEEDFFAGLRLYLQTYAHSSVTTEQFQAVMEAASGKDLSAFFQQWIYGEYYPVYAYSWSSSPVGEESGVALSIEQTQARTGLFTMPLDVLITTDLGEQTFVVDNSEQVESYSFTVPGQVLDLNLDPENWVLCEKELIVANPGGNNTERAPGQRAQPLQPGHRGLLHAAPRHVDRTDGLRRARTAGAESGAGRNARRG